MSSLSNLLATPDLLYKRAERRGIPQEVFDAVYISTQLLTQTAGIMLGQTQTLITQASVLLARYFVLGNWQDQEYPLLSAAIMYTLIRQEFPPCEVRNISVAYETLMSPSSTFRSAKTTKSSTEEIPKQIAYKLERTDALIIQYESDILRTLDFDVHVATPHPLALIYLQSLSHFDSPPETIGGMATALLNTALFSPQLLYLTHQPNELAVGAIYAACSMLKIKTPPVSWWDIFDVDGQVLEFLSLSMMNMQEAIERQNSAIPELAVGVITLNRVRKFLGRR